MKLFKKSVAYVLAFITVFSSFTILPSEFFHSAVVSAVEMLTVESQAKRTYKEGDFSYSIINDNEVEIVSYIGASTDIVIPDVTTGSKTQVLANKKVTAIGEEAFYGMPITSVTFGKNITDIGDNAFYQNTLLTNVDLSVCTNLAIIGDYAFYENSKLITLTLPDSLELIGNNAFYNCKKLTKLKTGSKLTDIGKNAFANCDNLSYVHILGGDSATIGYNAFYNCKALKAVTIGSGVEYISYEAFRNCTNLRELKMPNTIINIGINAFYNCTALEKVTIPDSVQSIGSCAFAYNNELKSVNIGSGCTFIGSNAFDGNKALESFTVSENNSEYSVFDGVLMNKDKSKIVLFPKGKSGTYTIPDTVKAIKAGTFAGCEKITDIVIGDGLVSISANTFEGCTNLQKITFGKKITSIGNSAFKDNKSLKELDFSACTWLTTIGDYAFYGNNEITSLKLPDSLQTIGDYAFADCDKFTTLEIGANIVTIGKEAFANCDSLNTVNIKGGDDATIGEKAFYDCDVVQAITIGDDINSIGSKAFAFCDKLETVTIGSGSTTIASNAFSDNKVLKSITVSNENTGCTSINGVLLNKEKTAIIFFPKSISGTFTIPDTVTEIPNQCFKDCINLTELKIGKGVKTLEDEVFYGCYNLSKITIGENVVSIGNNAFYGCNSLAEIIIGDSVTAIGDNAFSTCANLSKVIFGKNIKSIGKNAFYNNKILQTVDLSVCTDLTSIGDSAFYCNKALETVLLPDSLEIISDNCFYGCSSLTAIETKSNLTRIGDNAFYNCSKLKTVNINNCNNAVIGTGAFNRCLALENLTIGHGVVTISDKAFQECWALKKVEICNTVTTIGCEAFKNCSNLQEVIIGSRVTKIDKRAFYEGCSKLTRIQILSKNLSVLDYSTLPKSYKGTIYCYELSDTRYLLGSRGYSNRIRCFKEVYLNNIKINDSYIDNFDGKIRKYTVYVDDVTNVNVQPVFESTGFNYKVLSYDNVYTINIYNSDNIYSGMYTIIVKKSGSIVDAPPIDIKVNGVSIDNFNAETEEYTVYVYDMSKVTVEPVFEKEGCSYKVSVLKNIYLIDIFDSNNMYSSTYKIKVIEYACSVIGDINIKLSYNMNYSTVYGSVYLKPGIYKFKIAQGEYELGYNKSFTNSCNSLTLNKKYKSEITLNATGGQYDFIFDKETNKLRVKH